MPNRKETAAKILELMDGLNCYEADCASINPKVGMENFAQTPVEAVRVVEKEPLDRLLNNPTQSGLNRILFQHLLEQRILSQYREQCLLKLLRQSFESPPSNADLWHHLLSRECTGGK